MKRLMVAGAGPVLMVGWLLAASCSNPLETTSPPDPQIIGAIDSILITDTLTIRDTIFLSDSGSCVDTLYLTDSVVQVDTVLVTDSVVQVDTVFVGDSVVHVDTVLVTDSVVQVDTVFVGDSVVQIDTVLVIDSVIQVDTVLFTDSVFIGDTVHVVDTVQRVDTLVLADTVVQIDTVVVTIPNPTECPDLCSRLSSQQSNIVWLLFNAEGHYRLDFAAVVERDKPPQTLTVNAGGEVFSWTVQAESELTVEVDLEANARIEILVDNPKALGHSIDVCLEVTPL